MSIENMFGGRGFGFVMPAIWIFFLIFPIREALNIGGWQGGVSLGLTATFAVLYLWLCWGNSDDEFFPETLDWRTVLHLASLLAIVIAQLYLIGVMAIAMLIFIIGVLMFALPLRWAHAGAIILVAALFIPVVFIDGYSFVSLGIIGAGVYLSTAGARYYEKLSAENEEQAARAAVLDERDRLARDVHDTLGHSLTVIALKADLAGKLLEKSPNQARTELADVAELARRALAETRATVADMRNRTIGDELPRIVQAAEEAGLEVTVNGDPDDVDPSHRILFGWIAREGVTNVIRHAGATSLRIHLAPESITITDNGTGMSAPYGNGLSGLDERVAAAGGKLEIRDGHPGTVLEVQV